MCDRGPYEALSVGEMVAMAGEFWKVSSMRLEGGLFASGKEVMPRLDSGDVSR